MDVLGFVLALLSIGAVVVAVHIFITIVLPRLKDFTALVIKDEKANEGLVFLILVYVLVLGGSKVVKTLVGLGNQYISMVSIFSSGLELFTESTYYIAFLVMLLIGALALANINLSIGKKK